MINLKETLMRRENNLKTIAKKTWSERARRAWGPFTANTQRRPPPTPNSKLYEQRIGADSQPSMRPRRRSIQASSRSPSSLRTIPRYPTPLLKEKIPHPLPTTRHKSSYTCKTSSPKNPTILEKSQNGGRGGGCSITQTRTDT